MAQHIESIAWESPVPFDPIHFYGFLYLIHNTSKDKFYIGRKTFKFKRNKKTIESDWRTYTGSNKELNADIKAGDDYTKRIITFASAKGELNYYETFAILYSQALPSEHFYNNWVSCKITSTHVQKLKNIFPFKLQQIMNELQIVNFQINQQK
jgi:uncharacterized membrane protein YgaE (UPF0421/DUF939 family)